MCKTCRRKSVEAEQLRGVKELLIELEETARENECPDDNEADDGEFNEEGDSNDE